MKTTLLISTLTVNRYIHNITWILDIGRKRWFPRWFFWTIEYIRHSWMILLFGWWVMWRSIKVIPIKTLFLDFLHQILDILTLFYVWHIEIVEKVVTLLTIFFWRKLQYICHDYYYRCIFYVSVIEFQNYIASILWLINAK